MPEDMMNMDLNLKISKLKLKEWIKHRVPVRGDRILWGKSLVRRVAQKAEQGGEGGPRGEGGTNIEDQSRLLPRGLVQEEETQNATRTEGGAGVVPREGVGNTPEGELQQGEGTVGRCKATVTA